MKLLPDSIRTRTILVLLIGLTVSHLASMVVYSTDREQALATANEQRQADRLAVLAQVIDTTTESLRPEVAEAISGQTLHIVWDRKGAVPDSHQEDERRAVIAASLRPHFGVLDDSRLHVFVISPPGPAASPLSSTLHLLHHAPIDQRLQVSLELKDGSWIHFHLSVAETAGTWSRQALVSTLVMLLGTLVIAVWATRWITAPLASFAHAAERLGMDVSAQPLAEDGPQEVRAAARAFNQMQRRIRSFVEDRLQMLAAVSHDLRTPITRLRLRTEQLPIETEQQDKMLRDLDEMEQMVSSSMAFAKDEATDEPSQPFDLAALIGSICDDLTDAGLDADFDWSGRLVYRGRPLAMKRLFSNLIENAVRYGQCARVRAVSLPGRIKVVVEDQGPGIPEDQLEAVFKPFYRLESSRNKRTGGLGLGLSNVRTIARAHGGDVRLANRPEGGLSAVVSLPSNSEERQES
ncbi:ATP-binding protein [Telmatospirillum siberiense]|uniref:histidine kinase n=1 Tax=Telmatospirillum siberiense TaxID=382514 RepID=A0A2N3PV09_9PROT|nr:ATP-binding protein [Telmatospirillum siberiense]PKU24230.1 two-component sensor histidine kinase [Telmatospirillum siberiense]